MHVMHDASSAASAPELLAGIDLNLVVAFDALTRERSVTRAALRVGLTQSAMSHALRRLRDLLGDPLLVRGRGGMVLTPRAEALAGPVRGSLVALAHALRASGDFEPATTRRSFRLGAPDLFNLLVLPSLLARFRALAPNASLTATAIPSGSVGEILEAGELDFVIMPRLDEPNAPGSSDGPGLARTTLFRDQLTCFLRSDHPALSAVERRRRSRLSVARYLDLGHIVVSLGGSGAGPVDDALAARDLQRRVVLRLPSFYTALAVVARSDLVLTGPTGLSRLSPPVPSVASTPTPLPIAEHRVEMLWHERFSSDAAHAWMRALVAEVARGVGLGRPRGMPRSRKAHPRGA